MYTAKYIETTMDENGQFVVTARYQNGVFSYEGEAQTFTGTTQAEALAKMQADLTQFNIDHVNDRDELLPEEII